MLKLNIIHGLGPCNDMWMLPREELKSQQEQKVWDFQRMAINWLHGDLNDCWKGTECFEGNTDLDPTAISDELAAACPPTIIITSEYDFYRRSSDNMARKLIKN